MQICFQLPAFPKDNWNPLRVKHNEVVYSNTITKYKRFYFLLTSGYRRRKYRSAVFTWWCFRFLVPKDFFFFFFRWDMSYFTWLEEVWQWHYVTHLQNQDSVTVLSMGKAYIITNAHPEYTDHSWQTAGDRVCTTAQFKLFNFICAKETH